MFRDLEERGASGCWFIFAYGSRMKHVNPLMLWNTFNVVSVVIILFGTLHEREEWKEDDFEKSGTSLGCIFHSL